MKSQFEHNEHMQNLLTRISDFFVGESFQDIATACTYSIAFLLLEIEDMDERKETLENICILMASIVLDEDQESVMRKKS